MEIDTKKSVNNQVMPLKRLEDLLQWHPDSGLPVSIPIPQSNAWNKNINSRRTIVCHDMRGGYLADRFVNGCDVFPNEPYYFYHWSQIHAFIYFSHNLVTIPPTTWINAAHRNQVPVLGTFITEWDDGKAIWRTLLSDNNLLKHAATMLVEIAQFYGIDGWFVNIENSIEPENVEEIIMFLRWLRQGKRMDPQEVMSPKIVIWYDSVTIKGDLKWQNTLNGENLKFFHSVDGIFLNYNWTVENLKTSLEMAGAFRKYDVFVGVDVFGRGCLGGGGWNTFKALEVIKSFDMSVAIFAPGWVLECNDIGLFQENQETFWDSISQYIPSHPVYGLPILTHFCVGYGRNLFCNGKIQSRKVDPDASYWFNLSSQSLQPCRISKIPEICNTTEDILNARVYHEDSWKGGGCLSLIIPKTAGTWDILLFRTDVSLSDGHLSVALTLRLPERSLLHCSLVLLLREGLSERKLNLVCKDPSDGTKVSSTLTGIPPVKVIQSPSIADGNIWFTFRYNLTNILTKDAVMETISFRISKPERFATELILLGELEIS